MKKVIAKIKSKFKKEPKLQAPPAPQLPKEVVDNINKEEVVYKVAKHNKVIDIEPDFAWIKPWSWKNRKKHKEWAERDNLVSNSPDKVILIRMEMSNGFFREFLAEEETESFYYKGKTYALDTELKYYIIERNMWAYDFHENLSLPIRKKIRVSEDVQQVLDKLEDASRKGIKPQIPVNDIKKIIENSGFVDVENALNPTTLKRFIDTEVIKQVLQGAMLGKIFKIMMVLIIIIAIIQLLDFLVGLYASGVFDNLKNFFNKDG